MNWSKVFSVSLQVISDYRVIIVFICIILYLNFVIFVSRYRKQEFKPHMTKRRSSGASVVIPPPSSSSSSNNEED